MEEKREIDVEVFTRMFMAVSYTHEQMFLNLVNLAGYLWKNLTNGEALNQMEQVIEQMVNDKELIKVENHNCLYQISNQLDFKSIIEANQDYLDDIVSFFYNYYDNAVSNIKVISSSKKQK